VAGPAVAVPSVERSITEGFKMKTRSPIADIFCGALLIAGAIAVSKAAPAVKIQAGVRYFF
jgi:hypothetical protein